MWDAATPEEKAALVGRMVNTFYAHFRTRQILEMVPKPGFRCVFQATQITKPLACLTSDHPLTTGDPEGRRGPSN